jgi:hypothetical protein
MIEALKIEMHIKLEKWCEAYLKHRGRVVLPRAFFGAAFGFCHVTRTSPTELLVLLPFDVIHCSIIGLNNTIISDPPDQEGER